MVPYGINPRYPEERMHQWLYTLRLRLPLIDRSFLDGYRVFSGFAHVSEAVTLDSIICPDLIDELRAED